MTFLVSLTNVLLKSFQQDTLPVSSTSACIHNDYETSIKFVNLLIKICTKARHFALLSEAERLKQVSYQYQKYSNVLTRMHRVAFCKECALSFIAFHSETFMKLVQIHRSPTMESKGIHGIAQSVRKQSLFSIYCESIDKKDSYLLPIQLYFDIICNLICHRNINSYIFKNNTLFSPLLLFWKICWNYYKTQNHLQSIWGILPGNQIQTQSQLSQHILYKLSLHILMSSVYWRFQYDSTRYLKDTFVEIIPKYPWDEIHLSPPFIRYGMIHYIASTFHSMHSTLFDDFINGRINISHHTQNIEQIFSKETYSKQLALLLAFLAMCTRVYIKSKGYLYGLHHLGYIHNTMDSACDNICELYESAGSRYSKFVPLIKDLKMLFVGWIQVMSDIDKTNVVLWFNQWLKQCVKRNVLQDINVCGNMKCDQSATVFKKCSGCKVVFYCSRKCQKRHWNHHHRDQCIRL